MSKQCRWGILSTAGIARKNWQAIHDAGNAVVTAVTSRSVAVAQQFIDGCQAEVPFPQQPTALGSYDELIQRTDVDAIYLPLPTGMRKEWALRAARAGKHLLVEKPIGVHSAEVEEMIAECAKSNVQFMDGTMFMHHPRLAQMQQSIQRGDIGEIRHITAQFSFHGGDEFARTNIRTDGDLEPMGALGDVGWYCVRMILWAMGFQEPHTVTARVFSTMQNAKAQRSVPAEMSAELLFAGGASAQFHCSFVAQHCQLVKISGTQGYLTLQDFVLPFTGEAQRYEVLKSEFRAAGCRFDMMPHRYAYPQDTPATNAPGSQESRMMQCFSTLALSGKPDPYWPDIALKTQRVLDACMSSASTLTERVTEQNER
jgi:predicted dehydrogenase